jgi:hypothetical protein
MYVSANSTGEIPADEKRFFTKTWRKDEALAEERLLKTMYRPAAKAKVCGRVVQDYTVYTLSNEFIPAVLRGSHPADAELLSGKETSGRSFRRTL